MSCNSWGWNYKVSSLFALNCPFNSLSKLVLVLFSLLLEQTANFSGFQVIKIILGILSHKNSLSAIIKMFNRTWATFKANTPLLPHLVTAACWKACGRRKEYLCSVLFPLHPTSSSAASVSSRIGSRGERRGCQGFTWLSWTQSTMAAFGMAEFHCLLYPLMAIFVSFEELFPYSSKLPWWRQCLSPPTGFLQFLP